MLIEDLKARVDEFRVALRKVRESRETDFNWYPYDTLANVAHLDGMLSGDLRTRLVLEPGSRVLDIGCADGDLGYLLEDLGYTVHFLDYAPTNFNGMKGLTTLHDRLGSRARIHEIDIDSQFKLPDEYDLVLCLGLLYHLKNPFYFLETLAGRCRRCLVSTRVFRVAGDPPVHVADLPVAYLVAPQETNNDSTNYWIFAETGLKRLFERTGWNLLCCRSVGVLEDSNPSSADRDERCFCLLESVLRT